MLSTSSPPRGEEPALEEGGAAETDADAAAAEVALEVATEDSREERLEEAGVSAEDDGFPPFRREEAEPPSSPPPSPVDAPAFEFGFPVEATQPDSALPPPFGPWCLYILRQMGQRGRFAVDSSSGGSASREERRD